MHTIDRPFSALDLTAAALTVSELQALADLVVQSMRKVPANAEAQQLVGIVTACEQLAHKLREAGLGCEAVCDHLSDALFEAEALLAPPTLEELDGDVSDFLRNSRWVVQP